MRRRKPQIWLRHPNLGIAKSGPRSGLNLTKNDDADEDWKLSSFGGRVFFPAGETLNDSERAIASVWQICPSVSVP